MEEEAPSRRSVAELAGKFKGPASPHNTAANQTDKPVRRRPPRTLQIPKTQADEQETPGAISPIPAKAKRNSALIEKLQANLTLSPCALAASPKSPGFRLFPPTFTPSSPSSVPITPATTQSASVTPTTPVAASPLTEEGPTSFEDPPTVAEGSILTSINKNRARHSIRRRPPSRRSRKSSSGEETGEAIEGTDTTPCSPSEPENETRVQEGGGEGGGEGEGEGGKGEGGGEGEGEGGKGEGEGGEGGGEGDGGKGEGGEGEEERGGEGGGEGGEGEEERGGEGGGEDVKKEEDTEDMKDKGETESLTCPEKSDVEEQSTIDMQEKEEEKKNEGEEGDEASSSEKTDDKGQEEKDSGGKSEEDQTDASTEKEEKSEASS